MSVIPGARTLRTRLVLWIIALLLVALVVWIAWLAVHTSPVTPI
jgi:hypothetical protein